jgi:Domain of unknown function (DUF397)
MAEADAPVGGWCKSSRSESANCVEVKIEPNKVSLRHSGDRGGPILTFSYDEWQAFLDGVSLGEFELP